MRLNRRRGIGCAVLGLGIVLASCTPPPPSRPARPVTTRPHPVPAPPTTITPPGSTSTTPTPSTSTTSTTTTAPPTTSTTIPTPTEAPDGATFVAASGNDATGTGSVDRPYATLTNAVASTPSGGTIVLRGGVYHEGGIKLTRPVTIQAYPGEEAWLDGTTVPTGWVATGSTWRLADSPSAGLCRFGVDACVEDPSQIDPNFPMAGSPQSVLRDGIKLREVSTSTRVTPGTFSFNPLSGALEIGDDPTAATIEVVSQPKALDISASDVTIQGLGVRNYGSILSPRNIDGYNIAAVQAADGTGLVIDDVTFFQNSARGLFVTGSTDVRVTDSAFIENGLNGIDVFASSGVVLEGSRVVGNNAEHFSINPGAFAVAAGSKMVRTSDVTVRDNVFELNAATGWWCDEGCTDATVVDNRFAGNAKHGIFYEVSGGANIGSNEVVGNDGNGIYVIGPDNAVWDNTVVDNRQALAFYEDPRNRGPLDNTRNNVVYNNVLAGSTEPALNNLGEPAKVVDVQGFDYPESVDPGAMVTQLDHNAYDQSAGSADLVGWGSGGESTSFPDLATLRAETGHEVHGIEVDDISLPTAIPG